MTQTVQGEVRSESVQPVVAPPGSFQAWILAVRPATLWAGIAPVLVGTALAWHAGGFRLGPALGALMVAIWIQIGTNFANDVFDFEKGADTEDRLGPTRAVAAGLLTPRQMRAGLALALTLAFISGLYLSYEAGWPLFVIGLVAVVCAVAYTGGPFPLAYHGLGDIFVMIFFGFVAVCGTVYAQMLRIPELAWWCSVTVGCLSTAILVVNNLRDRETDARAGKRTLAVRLGATGTRVEYLLLLSVAYVVPGVVVGMGLASRWVLLPWVTLPLAVVLVRRVWTRDGGALNPLLGETARLLLLVSLLLGVGLVVG